MSDILLMLNRLRNRICHSNMVYEFTFVNNKKDRNNKTIYPQPLNKLINRFYSYKANKIRIKQVIEIFEIFIKTGLMLDLQKQLDDLNNKINMSVNNEQTKIKIKNNIKQHMRF